MLARNRLQTSASASGGSVGSGMLAAAPAAAAGVLHSSTHEDLIRFEAGRGEDGEALAVVKTEDVTAEEAVKAAEEAVKVS